MKEFRILKANIDMIKEYNKKLLIYSKADYLRNKDNIHSKIFSIKNQFNSLSDKLNTLKFHLKDKEKIDLIQSNQMKINKFIIEIYPVVEEILEKEKELSLTFMNITLNE
jgi:hypothetical protein